MRRKLLHLKGTIEEKAFSKEDIEQFGVTKIDDAEFSVTIYKKRNRSSVVYAATLLHELLHLWVSIIQQHDIIPEGMVQEHGLIERIEAFAEYFLHQLYYSRPKTLPKKKQKKYRKSKYFKEKNS